MRVFLAFLTIAALAIPAGADHCTGPSQSEHELNTCVADAAPCFYVDDDSCQPTCEGGNYYVYEESNGLEGLQRGDDHVDDTCHGMIAADTVVL